MNRFTERMSKQGPQKDLETSGLSADPTVRSKAWLLARLLNLLPGRPCQRETPTEAQIAHSRFVLSRYTSQDLTILICLQR